MYEPHNMNNQKNMLWPVAWKGTLKEINKDTQIMSPSISHQEIASCPELKISASDRPIGYLRQMLLQMARTSRISQIRYQG